MWLNTSPSRGDVDFECACVCEPVVWLSPVVQLACSLGPLLRVKLPLNWHQVFTHTQRPGRETTLPAGVSVRQPDAGEHVPPAEKNEHNDTCTRQLSPTSPAPPRYLLRMSLTGTSQHLLASLRPHAVHQRLPPQGLIRQVSVAPLRARHFGLANTAPWWAWY